MLAFGASDVSGRRAGAWKETRVNSGASGRRRLLRGADGHLYRSLFYVSLNHLERWVVESIWHSEHCGSASWAFLRIF